MDDNLCKQLKDAGFPKIAFQLVPTPSGKEEWFGTPTLSELIEACGDKFATLENCVTDKWCAWMKSEYRGEDISHCYGKTPEGAVANLYLKLNI